MFWGTQTRRFRRDDLLAPAKAAAKARDSNSEVAATNSLLEVGRGDVAE